MIRTLPLTLLAFALLPQTLTAQCDGCTPDLGCTIEPAFPTLCPLLPPDATAGEYYQQDFTFWLPSSFTEPGSGVTVDFQQMTITSVTGLPFGLSFTASDPAGVYYPQEDQYGCGRICGTPLGAGEYLITINIIASVTFSGFDIDAPQQFQLPLTVLPGTGGNSSFTYSPTSGCGSVEATFNALIDAAPSPTSYAWDFGNGNTSTLADPPAQTYSTPGTYVISLATTVGGYVLNTVNVTGVNDNWCGDVEEANIPLVGCTGSPDLYFVLTDGTGTTYTSGTVDNTTTGSWNGLGLLLDNAPYSIEFFDEDAVSQNDPLGTYNIPANGEGTYFINVAGGTTGSLVIGLEAQQVFTDTDTIVVFPAPDLVLSANGNQLCVANDTLASYVWFLDGDTIPTAATSCIAAQGPGVYTVSGTNAFGCTALSNELVVCPTLTITRNGNVLFVPDDFDSYAWTFNALPIGSDEPFVFTDGDGTYALTATNANGCTVTASYLLNTVGVEEAATASFPLALYPNPNDGRFTVVAEGLKEAVVQVEVIDLSGRAVHQWSATATNGRLRTDLALDLAAGTYLLRLRSGDGLSVTRLVVR
jgi:PKD repeat protein